MCNVVNKICISKLNDICRCRLQELYFVLKLLNFLFTSIFLFEAVVKMTAFGVMRYIKDRYNMCIRRLQSKMYFTLILAGSV